MCIENNDRRASATAANNPTLPTFKTRLFMTSAVLSMVFSMGSIGAQAAVAPIFEDTGVIVAPVPDLRDRDLEVYLTPGGGAPSDVRPASDYLDNFADDAGEAFFFAPGIGINTLDINEPRITARGFGLSNSFERSTLRFYQDGAPVTDVHGTTNIREVDLLSISHLEIWRGTGTDFQYSGGNLGGAVNAVSQTGLSRDPGFVVRADGGSSIEGTPGGRLQASLSGRMGDRWDYVASGSGNYETGFRDNNGREEGSFNANLGYTGNGSFATRFFVMAVRSNSELAGGLSLDEARLTPDSAAPDVTFGPLFPGGPVFTLADGAVADRWSRELTTGRVANETRLRVLGTDVTTNLHYTRREIDTSAVDFVGVSEESSDEWGAQLVLQRVFSFFGVDTQTRLGGTYSTGDLDNETFENIDGESGFQVFQRKQSSKNLTGFFEAAAKPFERLLVDVGVKFIRTDRDLTIGNNTEDARFTGVAARGGFEYRLRDDVQIFAGLSRTYEPPAFSELLSSDPADINGLDEQDAFTWEAGLRGRLRDRIGWDITYYNSDVEGEIINIEEPESNGFGATLVNADKTTHKGVEAGLDVLLFKTGAGSSVTWCSAYTYTDARFVDGGPLPVDGNRIGGVPEHLYRGELRYDADGNWFVAVSAEIALGNYFADHENLVQAPKYNVFGVSAGMRLNDNLEVFASGENVTDVQYAVGLVPVLDQTVQDGRIYTPANRARVYGGLRYRF